MVGKPGFLGGWTGEHVRHAAAMIWQGANPAARVYESIGADFFLAIAPGWLNLGLWEVPGSEGEAEAPPGQQEAAGLLLWQVGLLWRRRIIDYLLLRAVRP